MPAEEPTPATDLTVDEAPTVADADAERTIEEAALQKESHAHAAVSMRLTLIGALGCAALLQLVVHKRPVHWVITGLLFAIAGVSVYLDRTAAGVHRGRPPARLLLGLLMALAALLATAYLGLLSSTSLLLAIIVWAFASNDYAFEAWLVYLTCALGYLVLVALSLTHVLPLTGSVLGLQKENLRALFGLSILLEGLLAMVFWLAWTSRRATVGAISYVAKARLEVERRRALLDEARAELRQVRDAARLGRFSGRTIGDFQVGEVMGRGAMGEVYAAETKGSSAPVALKVLHPHLIDSPSEVERFVREVNITSALKSPHVVRVLGAGTASDGSPFLAMERLRGRDLAEILRSDGRLSLGDTVKLVREVASALGVAEQAGIVHRDVKPQNLFLVEGDAPSWKVLDFGVSRLVEATSSLTQGAIGTPAYMSPEQCRSAAVDHRADVFALSSVAYRALTGRPAFSGPDQYVILYSIVHEQPASPSELTMLPADVELVLALGLAKDPSERFQSATELAAALAQAQHNALGEELRGRARAILERSPWGSAPERSEEGANP